MGSRTEPERWQDGLGPDGLPRVGTRHATVTEARALRELLRLCRAVPQEGASPRPPPHLRQACHAHPGSWHTCHARPGSWHACHAHLGSRHTCHARPGSRPARRRRPPWAISSHPACGLWSNSGVGTVPLAAKGRGLVFKSREKTRWYDAGEHSTCACVCVWACAHTDTHLTQGNNAFFFLQLVWTGNC